VDSSPTALVEAIGYGFASGHLFSHGIPVPENIQNAMGNTAGMPGETASRGSTTTEGREDVNPITGQKWEDERIPDLSSMTDEEKEREAERLFVLFERMRKLGVVNVENPIRTAQQSGRFEELD
jgi:Guanine nucleotide exchange factor synembryn